MKKARMTEGQRLSSAKAAVADAIAAARAEDPAKANALLTHAVHDGVQPVELLAEIATQTGGEL